jgi:hypothetical protein
MISNADPSPSGPIVADDDMSRRTESERNAIRISPSAGQPERERSDHQETLGLKTRLATELQERIRDESERRTQVEAERDRLKSAVAVLSATASRSQRVNAALMSRMNALEASRWRRRISQLGALSTTLASLGWLEPGRALRSHLSFVAHPARLHEAYIITQSGLFDEEYYRERYSDVGTSRLSALAHFVLKGAREWRSPHPLFDSAWYSAQSTDVAASGTNPLLHYLFKGAREQRDPHPLFSASFYVGKNQNGAHRAANPLAHWVAYGYQEGRAPHPLFDVAYYLAQNPDVVAAGTDPLVHFLGFGYREARNPHPLFDVAYYQRQNPEVAQSGVNPLVHFRLQGAFEGRNPHPLFDVAYYLGANPDVRNAGVEPLTHFLERGAAEGRRPNPYFDCAFYENMYPDVRESGANPLVHFVCSGWREGRRPSPAFDSKYYLSRYADVRLGGHNPLVHYLEFGRFEDRRPVPDSTEEGTQQPVGLLPTVRLSARSHVARPAERPTVLCLSHVMPWPPRAGNEYRIYRMLRWLRDQGFRIVPVIAPLPGVDVAIDDLHALAEQFSNAVQCERDGRLEYILRDVPDVLASLNDAFTRPVAVLLDEQEPVDAHARALLQTDRTFCHDALITTVLRLHQVLCSYVLLAEYVWMSRVLPLITGNVLKIIDTIDVFSTKHEKVARFGIDEWQVQPHDEAQRLLNADLVVATQDEEQRELRRLVPGKQIITTGVDFDVVDDPGMPTGQRLLYVASDNAMNRKGLHDFLRFAWPLIRREIPKAELLLAGKVSQTVAGGPPGVIRIGPIDDLRPLYRQAKLSVNLAVAGTGLKIKTLESLCHLRPIVTWPNGTDGLTPELVALCEVAYDWYDFSRRVIRFLTAEESPRPISQDDRDTIIRLTSPKTVYRPLAEALAKFVECRPASAPVMSSVPNGRLDAPLST